MLGPTGLEGALSPPLERHPGLPEGHKGCWPVELTTGIAGDRHRVAVKAYLSSCVHFHSLKAGHTSHKAD